jgi:hypothetical protein
MTTKKYRCKPTPEDFGKNEINESEEREKSTVGN